MIFNTLIDVFFYEHLNLLLVMYKIIMEKIDADIYFLIKFTNSYSFFLNSNFSKYLYAFEINFFKSLI